MHLEQTLAFGWCVCVCHVHVLIVVDGLGGAVALTTCAVGLLPAQLFIWVCAAEFSFPLAQMSSAL